MSNNFNYNSLYNKFLDGRYLSEFPTDFFDTIQYNNGHPVIRTVRWKKVNMIEAYYEWTLPYTKNFELVGSYKNGICELDPNWYIARIISKQKDHITVKFDGIYDLAGSTYTEVYIDSETGGQVPPPKYKPSPTFKWSGGNAMIKEQSGGVITKLVPISLSEKEFPIFREILAAVERGSIVLPKAD